MPVVPALPYMGSKAKYAHELLSVIEQRHPAGGTFYDLFGGGAAMSIGATMRGHFYTMVYNEFDPAICALLKKVLTDGVTDEFYQWIGREDFKSLAGGTDWLAGMVKTVYSFGSGGQRSGYIYGKKIEPLKKMVHELIVDGINNNLLGITSDQLGDGGYHDRRMRFSKWCRENPHGSRVHHLERVSRIENLQRLDKLRRVEPFVAFNIENRSAFDFNPNSGVVYLDPPYFGTARYDNDICHGKFKEWVLGLSIPVYVSAYEIDWLECVHEIDTISTRAKNSNSKKVVERLYWNGIS